MTYIRDETTLCLICFVGTRFGPFEAVRKHPDVERQHYESGEKTHPDGQVLRPKIGEEKDKQEPQHHHRLTKVKVSPSVTESIAKYDEKVQPEHNGASGVHRGHKERDAAVIK